MSAPTHQPPRLLVVGGCTGLLGRAVRAEFGADHRLRSVHRHPAEAEASARIEVVASDAASVPDWTPLLEGVDTVLNLAWYRQAPRRRFVGLADGLLRLIADAEACGVRRFVHLSVPDAPPSLETGLPYLREKRRVDRGLAASGLDYVIVRPTMLFGPGDRLLTVMLRTIRRYGRFPMFGDGGYHISPLAAADLASVLRVEAERGGRRTVSVGGPRRWVYRDLTDALFRALGRTPRYLRLSPRGSLRVARLLESLGSSLIYAYEVEWLLSDMLGIPAYEGLPRPLAEVAPFLTDQARGYRGSDDRHRGR
jgi:uncharacterized protein YbjT (DUF2867 family)